MPSLFPYQQEAVRWIADRPACLLADQMGLGKTPTACAVLNFPEIARAVVVCPASLKTNWLRELSTWSPLLLAGMAEGSRWPEGVDVVVVNYDLLKGHADRLREREWDCLVVDEAHYCKAQKSQRTQYLFGSRAIPPIRARRKLLMTGTPIVNRPVELYPLLRYLDPHGWPSYDEFGVRYCGGGGKAIIQAYGASRGDWNAWCWKNNVAPSRVVPLSAWRQFRQEVGSRGMRVKEMAEYSGATNLEELRDRLYSTIMLRRLKRDVLPDLPPKIRQVVELSPSGAVSRRIAEEARLARAAGVDAETLSEAGFRASVSALRGPAAEAWEEMAVVRHELAMAKLPYVVDHLRDALEGGKVVCFAHHRALVAGLAEAFPGSVQVVGGMRPEEKQAAVDAFQGNDSVRLFIGSTAAAEGLTLTAASHVVLAETFWVPGLVSQMEDRCHRIGQRDSVLCQWLVFADSLDAHIAQTVIRKQGVIEKTIG